MLFGRRPDGSIPDRGAIETLEGLAPSIAHALLAITARDRRMKALAASLSDPAAHAAGPIALAMPR
jgi:hypothetical protein